jgi:hypothetical protein
VPLVPGQNDGCLYTCKENRGCSVELIAKALVSGSIKGSCFPKSFGGAGSGIPESCSTCSDVCIARSEGEAKEFVLPLTREMPNKGKSLVLNFL